MKKIYLSIFIFATAGIQFLSAQIDMQAHIGSSEAAKAYTEFLSKQYAYYTGNYSSESLHELEGDDLFGALNSLMGGTSRIGGSGFSYNSLRDAYKSVDRDLNTPGKIIGYYDGSSMNGQWDSGKTWNREHTWPQSKGADKSIPMGHDMQSVRPANTAINGDRGNSGYGESGKCYDPDDVKISNSFYSSANLGSYRGDAARVIIYDYVVYGEAGGHKNNLYNGNAQLLSKVNNGANGVFESIPILLKWHMNDPVSLTEMVRNDGAETYQGNRNPFIDYPELAILMLRNVNGVKTYNVNATGVNMTPSYTLTLSDGFIAYLGTPDTRPAEVSVKGAQYNYDAANGRLTIRNVTGSVSISAATGEAVEMTRDGQQAIKTIRNGQVVIIKGGHIYNLTGQRIE